MRGDAAGVVSPAMCHDSNAKTEETVASRPGFLVVEQLEPWQDYTIHPYFVLSTAFPLRHPAPAPHHKNCLSLIFCPKK
jgi:hypothetical protein